MVADLQPAIQILDKSIHLLLASSGAWERLSLGKLSFWKAKRDRLIDLLGLCPTYDYVLRILAQSFELLCGCKSGSYRRVRLFLDKTYWFDGRSEKICWFSAVVDRGRNPVSLVVMRAGLITGELLKGCSSWIWYYLQKTEAIITAIVAIII